jgi:hypothetical protein
VPIRVIRQKRRSDEHRSDATWEVIILVLVIPTKKPDLRERGRTKKRPSLRRMPHVFGGLFVNAAGILSCGAPCKQKIK